MSAYLKAILVHGLAVPGIVIALLLGGSWYGLTKVHQKKSTVHRVVTDHADLSRELAAAGAKLEGRTERMAAWDEKLQGEVIQSVARSLDDIMEAFEDDELKQTVLGRPSGRSSFAGRTEIPHSQFKVSFTGGFGPMQEVLAELETQNPHLILESLTLTPSRKHAALDFDATFTCWNRLPRS